MTYRISGSGVFGVLLVAALAGCGGSVSTSNYSTPPRTTPPTSVALQPNSALSSAAGTITADLAIKGSVIFVGSTRDFANVLWVGSHNYYCYTDLAFAFLLTANDDYGIGSYEGGSFLWPYRSGGAIIPVVSDSITAAAKNADMFFDLQTSSDGETQTANLLTLKGQKLVRVPYNLPVIDSGDSITGVAINASGLALVNESAFESFSGKKRLAPSASRRDAWIKMAGPIRGTPSERLAQIKLRAKQMSTTTTSQTGYYLCSTTTAPIPLGLPSGGLSAVVLSMNDSGVSVGAVYTGDPNNPSLTAYYWDAQGNPHVFQVPTDVTFAYAEDINQNGTAVGVCGNDITQYGAMWSTLASNPTNVNSLAPGNFPYDVYSVDSIGNDFTMTASCISKTNSDLAYYVGLQPL